MRHCLHCGANIEIVSTEDVRHAAYCCNCTTKLTNNLRLLARYLPDLESVASRKSKVVAVSSGHASRTVAPIPVNMPAFQLADEIDVFARRLGKVLALRFGRTQSVVSLLNAAASRVDRLSDHPQFNRIIALAASYWSRMHMLLTPPDERRLIGTCSQCGRWLWVADTELEAGWLVCKCHAELKIRDVQQQHLLTCALAQGDHAQGTAAAIERLLATNGIVVRRQTISQWKKRGVIKPVGVQDGKPVFRVWDVWMALNR